MTDRCDVGKLTPQNYRQTTNIGIMLDQRRRRWSCIIPILGQRLVFIRILFDTKYHNLKIICLELATQKVTNKAVMYNHTNNTKIFICETNNIIMQRVF